MLSTLVAGLAGLALSHALAVAPVLDARSDVRLGQAQAEAILTDAGITWASSGHCVDRTVPTCTSLEGVRASTLDGVVALEQACGCEIVVTGGTEVGHANGTYSHANGYKLDLRRSAALTDFIVDTYDEHGVRADGYPLWVDDEGNVYADEGNHWDVVYY